MSNERETAKATKRKARIQRFEDLIGWQKARELTTVAYRLTAKNRFSKDFGLRDQIRRASVSIMSNLAEGFERMGNAEFHRFLVMAKASCAEVRSQLYVALDVGYISREEFNQVHRMAEEVARILGGLRATVEKKREMSVVAQHSRPWYPDPIGEGASHWCLTSLIWPMHKSFPKH